jgi:hypothetical protein
MARRWHGAPRYRLVEPVMTEGNRSDQRFGSAPDGIRTRAAGLKGRRNGAGQKGKTQVSGGFGGQ